MGATSFENVGGTETLLLLEDEEGLQRLAREVLQDHGYKIIETSGWQSALELASQHPGPIDLVNVFRRPEFCADVARDAAAVGAKGLWLQSGIRNEEARRIAEEAKMDYVQDRCIMVEHMQRRR